MLEARERSLIAANVPDPAEFEHTRPLTMLDYRPPPEWEGVGVAVLNGPYGFNEDARDVALALKDILGLPNNNVTQRFGSLHEPAIFEVSSFRSVSTTCLSLSLSLSLPSLAYPLSLSHSYPLLVYALPPLPPAQFGESFTRFSNANAGPPLPEEYVGLDVPDLNRAHLEEYRRTMLPMFDYIKHYPQPLDSDDALDGDVASAMAARLMAEKDQPAEVRYTKKDARAIRKESYQYRVHTARQANRLSHMAATMRPEIEDRTNADVVDDDMKKSGFVSFYNVHLNKHDTDERAQFIEEQSQIEAAEAQADKAEAAIAGVHAEMLITDLPKGRTPSFTAAGDAAFAAAEAKAAAAKAAGGKK